MLDYVILHQHVTSSIVLQAEAAPPGAAAGRRPDGYHPNMICLMIYRYTYTYTVQLSAHKGRRPARGGRGTV